MRSYYPVFIAFYLLSSILFVDKNVFEYLFFLLTFLRGNCCVKRIFCVIGLFLFRLKISCGFVRRLYYLLNYNSDFINKTLILRNCEPKEYFLIDVLNTRWWLTHSSKSKPRYLPLNFSHESMLLHINVFYS